MSGLSYRSKSDMRELSLALLASRPQIALAAFIIDHDLMRPQWWVRFLFWVIRKRHKTTFHAWAMLEERNPGQSKALIEATADWIVSGKDRTTKDAAGGFNQREVDLLHAAMIAINSRGWPA